MPHYRFLSRPNFENRELIFDRLMPILYNSRVREYDIYDRSASIILIYFFERFSSPSWSNNILKFRFRVYGLSTNRAGGYRGQIIEPYLPPLCRSIAWFAFFDVLREKSFTFERLSICLWLWLVELITKNKPRLFSILLYVSRSKINLIFMSIFAFEFRTIFECHPLTKKRRSMIC
jgi:hypothetical protein